MVDMPFDFTMPKLSPTMTEGVIAKWHKNPGDFIEAGDLVVEISTDKATVEHNALDPGWLRKILVPEGGKALVNEPLAIMTQEQNESFDSVVPAEKKQAATAEVATTTTASQQPTEKQEVKLASVHTSSSDRIIASPLAKKLAHTMGISLEGVQGSGPRGRIMSRDLEKIQEKNTSHSKATASPQQKHAIPCKNESSVSEEVRVEVLSPMRQVIAKRLQTSKATIPHFYATVEVDVRKLLNIREEMKASGLSITVNDFIVKASALSLMDHPVVRTNFDEATNTVTYFPHADISVAVSINGGLITPIVARAEEKSLSSISKEIKSLAEKAKANKLLPQEFIGGNFTISNLGMFGTSDFQAIINPPQVAILAVGSALDQPIIENGQCIPGKVMKLTLSCDHRVVDGADAAKFLHTLKSLLENPVLILGR